MIGRDCHLMEILRELQTQVSEASDVQTIRSPEVPESETEQRNTKNQPREVTDIIFIYLNLWTLEIRINRIEDAWKNKHHYFGS